MLIKPGLERIRALCAALGEPQAACPAALIAGTNGKGSTAAMLDGALRAGGVRTGLYTSPHLVRETERLRLGGAEVEAGALTAARARVEQAARGAGVEPSWFEAFTAAAFLLLEDAGVERAVLEVGLGGRWDATWIARADVGLVTSIGLEHRDWLGDTLEAIAVEKAAIARPGMTLFSGVDPALHDAVIAPVARGLGATVLHRDRTGWTPGEGVLTSPTGRVVRVPFPGAVYASNAALAAAAAAHLGVPEAAIAAGLEAATFPGRYQIVARAPWLIADTAHNPSAFAALADLHARAHPGATFHIALGLKPDKDAAGIAPYLARMARVVHVVEGEDLRPAADLAALLRARGLDARPAGDLTALPALVADLRARATDLLVTGSHHVVGALLAAG